MFKWIKNFLEKLLNKNIKMIEAPIANPIHSQSTKSEKENQFLLNLKRHANSEAFDEEKDCPVAGAIVSCDPLECEQLLIEAKDEIGTLAISEIGPKEYYESIKKLLEKYFHTIQILILYKII